MWLSFSCILEFPLFPVALHNTCSCYYLHSQIDADKDSVFWLVNLHPSPFKFFDSSFLYGIHDQKTWIQETWMETWMQNLYRVYRA